MYCFLTSQTLGPFKALFWCLGQYHRGPMSFHTGLGQGRGGVWLPRQMGA